MDVGDIHCLIFLAPPECRREGSRTYSRSGTPGVYLKREGASPGVRPKNAERLLTRDQALLIARTLDSIAGVSPGDRNYPATSDPAEQYPTSYSEFVVRWYQLLAERLERAIAAADARREELRLVRASLTGEVR